MMVTESLVLFWPAPYFILICTVHNTNARTVEYFYTCQVQPRIICVFVLTVYVVNPFDDVLCDK